MDDKQKQTSRVFNKKSALKSPGQGSIKYIVYTTSCIKALTQEPNQVYPQRTHLPILDLIHSHSQYSEYTLLARSINLRICIS